MILGDYTLQQKVCEGPFGELYIAEHRFLKKPFALKILPNDADEEFIARVEKEVAALATLDHPHIAKMHAFGSAEGKYYIVSDYVTDDAGHITDLGTYLAKNSHVSEEEIAQILSQVASALDYAHERKMGTQSFVHRGLKLSNVLISKRNPGIQVALTDFGMYRIMGEGFVLSKISQGVGTAFEQEEKELERFVTCFDFLSPEQKMLGKSRFISGKADIYAFGLLAYRLLMGHMPEGYFPMPSRSERGYKLNWDELISKCLHPNPAMRPTTLHALMGGLAQVKKPAFVQPKVEAPEPAMAMAGATTYEQPKPKIMPQEIERPTYEENPATMFEVEKSVGRYVPEQKEKVDIEPIQTEMVSVPAGEYNRGSADGSRDERPEHIVSIPSFAIDVHPVTNEQFVRFLEAMNGEKDVNNNDIIRLRESRIKRVAGKISIEAGYSKHPVVGVSWYGAIAYAKWVGKRLPTEAEWEIAARGGLSGMLYPSGETIDRSQANFFSADTVKVCSYAPNPLGIYDMAGNVYDWCEDWYDYNYYEVSAQEPENPKGPQQGVYRVLRGGCWKSLTDDLRCAHRHRNNPGTVNKTYGFRCAADAE